MNKRVWIISELYYPEETSTGYLLTQIAEGLASKHVVQVICSQPTYSARGKNAPMFELHNGVTIHRYPSTTFNKDVLWLRIVNLLTISISTFFWTVWKVRADDQVLVVTNPPLVPFVVGLACKLRRAQGILLVHDVYPDLLIATKMLSKESYTTKFLEKVNSYLYRSMKRIIVLGRDMKELAQNKLGKASERIVIITNWADLDQIVPLNKENNKLLKKLDLQDKFIIQYSGNMGRTHGLEYIVEAMKQLQFIQPDVHILFIGSGAKKQWLVEAVQEYRLSNITVLPSCPRSELNDYLNACDIAIISFIPGMMGVSLPSRMYNILAAGKPILAVAVDNSEISLVVQEEQVGRVVPPENIELLVNTILELYRAKECLHRMGLCARRVAENKYSLHKVMDAYSALIDNLEHEIHG